MMAYDVKPLAFDHARIKGMSEKLIVSHYEKMDNGARAAAYVDAVMAAINWPKLGRLFAELSKG